MTNRMFKAGASREQGSLLLRGLKITSGRTIRVRAIESYVGALDLAQLGFRHADRGEGVG